MGDDDVRYVRLPCPHSFVSFSRFLRVRFISPSTLASVVTMYGLLYVGKAVGSLAMIFNLMIHSWSSEGVGGM